MYCRKIYCLSKYNCQKIAVHARILNTTTPIADNITAIRLFARGDKITDTTVMDTTKSTGCHQVTLKNITIMSAR
jgi:DNA-binding protein